MAIQITNGTTAYNASVGGVLIRSGASTTDCSLIDIQMDDAIARGYRHLIIELSSISVSQGSPLNMMGMSAASTEVDSGYYAGVTAWGESTSDISTNSVTLAGDTSFKLMGTQTSHDLTEYNGFFTIHVHFSSYSNKNPSVYWDGTMRLGTSKASRILGGGTNNQTSIDYGIRIATTGGNNILNYEYALFGRKIGGTA